MKAKRFLMSNYFFRYCSSFSGNFKEVDSLGLIRKIQLFAYYTNSVLYLFAIHHAALAVNKYRTNP